MTGLEGRPSPPLPSRPGPPGLLDQTAGHLWPLRAVRQTMAHRGELDAASDAPRRVGRIASSILGIPGSAPRAEAGRRRRRRRRRRKSAQVDRCFRGTRGERCP